MDEGPIRPPILSGIQTFDEIRAVRVGLQRAAHKIQDRPVGRSRVPIDHLRSGERATGRQRHGIRVSAGGTNHQIQGFGGVHHYATAVADV